VNAIVSSGSQPPNCRVQEFQFGHWLLVVPHEMVVVESFLQETAVAEASPDCHLRPRRHHLREHQQHVHLPFREFFESIF
jgi:hypothetical protein